MTKEKIREIIGKWFYSPKFSECGMSLADITELLLSLRNTELTELEETVNARIEEYIKWKKEYVEEEDLLNASICDAKADCLSHDILTLLKSHREK